MRAVKYFEDVVVGEEYDFPGEHRLTKEEIVRVASEWDPQPFHIDEEAAASSMFGGLVASSVHLFSIAVKLAATATEKRAAVSALGFDEVRVLQPARPGDVLRYRSRCIAKRESKSRPELGIIQGHGELFNQNGEVIFSLKTAALFAKAPSQR
jgi:acyl dehydratase